MSYATITNLKNRLNITMTDATRDTVLSDLLEASSAAIDGLCNKPFGFLAASVATVRYYPGSGTAYQIIDECVEITAVAVKLSATASTYTAWTTPTTNFAGDGDWIPFRGSAKDPEFNRLPFNGIMVDLNGTSQNIFTSGKFTSRPGFRPDSEAVRNVPTVQVTARWGYADTIPSQVREACVVQAAQWWKRGESGWATGTASAEMGVLEFEKSLDPAVIKMLVKARLVTPAIG